MADAASITMSATILPDEIAKTITGLTAGYTPADANDKWYFKISTISTSANEALIAGSYISEETGPRAHDTIATSDKVKFLFIKNTDGSNSAYLTFDNNTSAATSVGDALVIPAGSSWFGLFENLTVDDLHARSASGSPILQVAAILDDV